MCEICLNYTGKNSNDLHSHVRSKHGVQPYKFLCPLCKKFQDSSVVNVACHILKKECSFTKGAHFCKFCQYNSLHVEKLIDHIFSSHFPNIITFKGCSECDYMSINSHSATQHMMDAHGLEFDPESCNFQTTITCNLCSDYDCEREHTWRKHMNTKHPQISYSCLFKGCPYRTNMFWEFSDHLFYSHLKSVHWYYKCSECSTGFLAKQSLKQHLNDKHDIQEYCSICWSYYDDLVEHLHSDHKLVFSQFYCGLCDDDEDFENESDVYVHLDDEHGIQFLDAWDYID